MKYSPVFYDFKRGFLRISVLLILIVFILSGVGLAYMVSTTLRTMPIGAVDRVVIALLDTETGVLRLEGYVYDSQLRDLKGRLGYDIFCYPGSTSIGKSTRYGQQDRSLAINISSEWISFSGRFVFEKLITPMPNITSDHMCYITINIDTGFGYSTTYSGMGSIKRGNSTVFYLVYSALGFTGAVLSEDHVSVGGVKIRSFVNKTDVILTGAIIVPPRPDLVLDLYIREQGPQEVITLTTDDIQKIIEDPGNYGYVKTASIEQGLFMLKTTLRNESTIALHYLFLGRCGDNEVFYAIASTPLESISTIDPRAEAVTRILTGQTGLGLFVTFFPIVMMYLAYVYIAKPRSQGALEFIIARPITRLNLYITRLIAGIMVALISVAVFYLAIVVTMQLLLDVSLDLYVHLLIYSGLVLSLIAFYSLCYFLSTITRGTRYLVLALFLYIFFTIIMNVVVFIATRFMYGQYYFGPGLYEEIIKAQFMSKYFTPLGIQDFVQYYVQRYYNISMYGIKPEILENVVNPWAVVFSIITWISVPIIAGWFVFKKANLSS